MTTRLLVLSDTHVADAAALPASLLGLAQTADQIIHCGDHSVLEVVFVLSQFAPVTAVCGNVESAEVSAALPHQQTLRIEGVSIGVVHDPGPAGGRRTRLEQMFPDCSVICFGHTHQPECDEGGAALLLNPGSPTQRRRAPFHSCAWLEIADGAVIASEIVRLD